MENFQTTERHDNTFIKWPWRSSIIEKYPEYKFVPTDFIPVFNNRQKGIKKTNRIIWTIFFVGFALIIIGYIFFYKYEYQRVSMLKDRYGDYFDLLDWWWANVDGFFNDGTWYEWLGSIGGGMCICCLWILVVILIIKRTIKALSIRSQKYIQEADYVEKTWRFSKYIFFVKDRKFGLFDKVEIVIPAEYDRLSWKEKGRILVAERNGETFLIDIFGNRLT